jgi:hypothetical protein
MNFVSGIPEPKLRQQSTNAREAKQPIDCIIDIHPFGEYWTEADKNNSDSHVFTIPSGTGGETDFICVVHLSV